jgi:hypothetical protein
MKDGMTKIVGFTPYKTILERDVEWGAGGSFNIGISDSKDFYERFKEFQKDPDYRKMRFCVPDDYEFVRRERFSLTVRGKIILVREVLTKRSQCHINKKLEKTINPVSFLHFNLPVLMH